MVAVDEAALGDAPAAKDSTKVVSASCEPAQGSVPAQEP